VAVQDASFAWSLPGVVQLGLTTATRAVPGNAAAKGLVPEQGSLTLFECSCQPFCPSMLHLGPWHTMSGFLGHEQSSCLAAGAISNAGLSNLVMQNTTHWPSRVLLGKLLAAAALMLTNTAHSCCDAP
jgi:hypothetical protein